MPRDFFDPTPEEQNVVLIDAPVFQTLTFWNTRNRLARPLETFENGED
jgi:hypothetical protein